MACLCPIATILSPDNNPSNSSSSSRSSGVHGSVLSAQQLPCIKSLVHRRGSDPQEATGPDQRQQHTEATGKVCPTAGSMLRLLPPHLKSGPHPAAPLLPPALLLFTTSFLTWRTRQRQRRWRDEAGVSVVSSQGKKRVVFKPIKQLMQDILLLACNVHQLHIGFM